MSKILYDGARRSRAYDGLDVYLSQISGPLLTREEEFALAVKKMRGNRNARRELINRNLKLVVNVAKKYTYRGVPLLDLISEGNQGLMEGIDRYNPYNKKKAKLSTYARYYVRKNILNALKKERRRYLAKYHPKDGPVTFVSIDEPTGDDGESMETLITDIHARMPYDDICERSDSAFVHNLLKKLNPQQRKVLELRFLRLNGKKKTLEEIGKIYHVTRERIRQIQNEALAKLRAN
ncbi:sigma-70 family RNA polymerase sigma factor [Candidatus Pacearchaeota archaeon]|nr:hypothetical protein [uncultured archaeon]AQS33203.1 hypothetical protein [uncultured archaeon]MBS3091575.1 sigma-70 family RNA polymerase sigma factor [Candidatus Pacearchaeota archaeon]